MSSSAPPDEENRAWALVFPPFRLDPGDGRLWHGDRVVALRPRAFEVLRCLLEHAGQLVTREELLSRFWGDAHLSEGVLKTQIGEIRLALGDDAKAPRFIETVHRRGYRFVGQCERVPRSRLPAARPALPGGPPQAPWPAQHIVGREKELQFLSERWQRAGTGQRQAVLLGGEAGIGKTALAQAFLQRVQAAEPEAWVSWGQCVEQYGSGEPYLPIIDILRKAWGSPRERLIAECLQRVAPSWLALMPAAQGGAAAALAAPGAAGPLLRQIVDALEELASRCGVLLLLEDLHWADHSTLDLIAYLAQRTGAARLMLLGTYRPVEARSGRLADVSSILMARGRCSELPVMQLSLAAMREYLAQRFPDHALPGSVAELLHRRTDGNALFMVGIVEDWLQRELLSTTTGQCQVSASVDELERWVPDSFLRMVERDLERLTPLERNVLDAASVAGNEFSVATVAAALLEDTVTVEEVCMRWARRGQFLRSTGVVEWHDGTVAERCQFLHALYQQVAYQRLGAARQAQLHQRIGQRLERAYGSDADNISSELALHFEQSRDHAQAVRYLRAAAERALQRGAFHEATTHLRRALQLVPKLPEEADKPGTELELLVLLVLPLRITKGYAASELKQAYTRAADLCEGRATPAQLFVVLAGRAAFHLLRMEYGEAAELGDQFLSLATATGDPAGIADAQLVVGAAAHFLGNQQKAESHLSSVVEFHDRRQGTWTSSLDYGFPARGMHAYTLWMRGFPERSRRAGQDALEKARALANPFAMAYGSSYLASILFLRGDLAEADELATRHAALCDEHGFEMLAPFAGMVRGAVALERGDFGTAVARLSSALGAYAATGSGSYRALWCGLLARAVAGVGQQRSAFELLDGLLQGEVSHREGLWEADVYRIKGELLLSAEGATASVGQCLPRHPQAEACFSTALQMARQQGAKPLELRAALSLASYWRQRGDVTPWLQLVRDVYGWFSEGFDTADLVRARALLAELAGAAGSPSGM